MWKPDGVFLLTQGELMKAKRSHHMLYSNYANSNADDNEVHNISQ